MRIYKSEDGSIYFAQHQDKGWFCFISTKPDIYTVKLCPCSFGYEEEKTAWNSSIEIPSDRYVHFNTIAQQQNNYDDICSFIKEYYDILQEQLDRQFDHYPELIELTNKIIEEYGKERIYDFYYDDIYRNIKYHMQIWNNDIERVRKYAIEHDIPSTVSFDDTIVDIFGECHPTKRFLLHEFHGNWGDNLSKIIDKAVELYPDENDFDKAFYFTKNELNGLFNKKTV